MNTEIIQKTFDKSLEDIEKQLKSNLDGLMWNIDNIESLWTTEAEKIKIYFGTTSGYGGVTAVSFLNHGGGHVPYYIKLIQKDYSKTEVVVIVTGSENVYEDFGNRNRNIMNQLLEMCDNDCTHKSFKDKLKDIFRK